MTENELILTASQINYLITVYRLNGDDTGIRCVDIAKALGISKPSVHTMMKTLSSMKLVKKTKYGNVFLLQDGINTAAQYSKYYEIVHNHFEKSFCFSPMQAKRLALAVLSELPLENIQNMCEHINQNKRKY